MAHAELYFAPSKKLAEQNEDSYLLAFAWRALAQVYADQTQWAAAEQAIRQATWLFQDWEIGVEIDKTAAVMARIQSAVMQR
jgi:hypothetical protein